MFQRIREFIKSRLEGNKCRFGGGCTHYRREASACNRYIVRFPSADRVYCGTYRGIIAKRGQRNQLDG